MIVWVALSASGGLALLALHSMAYAFASSLNARPISSSTERNRAEVSVTRRLRRRDIAVLLLEIALSVGIALSIVGLAAMAALPGRMMIGALLAQLAVLGSLVAPPSTVRVLGSHVRPAGLALGVAQLANAVFFIKAIQALL